MPISSNTAWVNVCKGEDAHCEKVILHAPPGSDAAATEHAPLLLGSVDRAGCSLHSRPADAAVQAIARGVDAGSGAGTSSATQHASSVQDRLEELQRAVCTAATHSLT